MDKQILDQIIQDLDNENNRDPRKINYEGEEIGYELFYSKLMIKWIKKIAEEPTNALLIAGRAIHIKRWLYPRDKYPKGLSGYHQWKNELQNYHQKETVNLLKPYKLDESILNKISNLILKKELGKCSEMQILEDAVSLIFIEHQLVPLLEKSSEEKVINAIQKTWAKMSEVGRKLALELNLDEKSSEIIKTALNS